MSREGPRTAPSLLYKPNLAEVVRRHAAVWRLEQLDRPLIFIDEEDAGVRTAGHRSEWLDDIDGFVAFAEKYFAKRSAVADDRLPILRPPFSHGILPGLMGAELSDSSGALWVEGKACASPEEFLSRRMDPGSGIGRRFAAYYSRLLALAAGKFLVSTYDALGPCDLAGALLGAEEWMLLTAAEPEQAAAVALHAAEQAVEFYRWTARLVEEQQDSLGGTILSQMWAPTETIYFSDHTALNLGPEIYEKVILPAERHLTESFSSAYISIYPQAAAAILGPTLAGNEKVRVVYGCEENPADELLLRYAGERIFFLRCRSREEIDRYRKLTGDRGLIIWMFVSDVGEANKLIESL